MRLFLLSLIAVVSYMAGATNLEIHTSDTVICSGDVVTLEATSGFYNYVWNTGDSSRVIRTDDGGWYIVEAQDSGGTTYSDSIFITEYTTKTLNYYTSSSSDTICKGDSIVIELTEGFRSYWWNTGHRYDRAILTPTSDKRIVVEATDSNGCEARIEFTIYVQDCDTCNMLYHDSIVKCGVDSFILEAKYGYAHYEWQDGSDGRLYTVKESGWYTVEVEDSAFFCTDSVYVELNEGKELRYETDPEDGVICKGDSIFIELTAGFKSYWWSTGHRYRTAWFSPERNKTIVIEALDSNGCEDRIEIEITVEDCDSCNFFNKDTIRKCADSVILEAKYGYAHYTWQDGSDGRIHVAKESGWYVVEVEDSAFLCKDSIYVDLGSGKELRYEMEPEDGVICEGDSVLIELTSGFKSYWWNTGHRYNRAWLKLERSKTVVIEALDSNGCEARIEIEITVEECDDCELFETDSLFRCGEDSVILEAPSGYAHYLWPNDSTYRLYTVRESGWYVLEVEDSAFYCIDSIYVDLDAYRDIGVYSNPQNRKVCLGDSIVIELGGDFDNYWWSTGHTGDRNVLYPRQNMRIVVEGKDSNGCEGRVVFEIEVVRCNASIANLQEIADIYPNPANNYFTFNLKSGDDLGKTLKIFDAYGQLIKEQLINEMTTTIDVNDLANGVILVKFGNRHARLLLNH